MRVDAWWVDPPESLTVRCLGKVSADAAYLADLTQLGLTFSLLPSNRGVRKLRAPGPLMEEDHPDQTPSSLLFSRRHRNPSFRDGYFNTTFLI